jgi:hypothetical protein
VSDIFAGLTSQRTRLRALVHSLDGKCSADYFTSSRTYSCGGELKRMLEEHPSISSGVALLNPQPSLGGPCLDSVGQYIEE